jgi:hypothetical protein
VVYFEIGLLFLFKNDIYYHKMKTLTMKTLTLHTNYCLPTLKVWAGISMFNSQFRIKKSEDTDVG